MAAAPRHPVPNVASVDSLIDEDGSRVDMPNGSPTRVAGEHEASLAATSPTSWWLHGIVGLGMVVAVLFLMQMLQGAPTVPVAEPVVPTP